MKEDLNRVTEAIIGAAIEVHRDLGPGLPESSYEACLDCAYGIDLLVAGVVVELKSVERLEPIHEAQMVSYLKLSGCKVGLLINFNVRLLKDGIRRFVQDMAE